MNDLNATPIAQPQPWLAPTAQLDFLHPTMRDRVRWLTSSSRSAVGNALAIHHFVQSMPFGMGANFKNITASAVLAQGYGGSVSKGLLMVALLRAAGIPARLRFVSLSSNILHGLGNTKKETVIHAYSEIWLQSDWQQVDTYVYDLAYMAAARQRLSSEWRLVGYALHLNGRTQWDGTGSSLASQSLNDPASYPMQDWGAADDLSGFRGSFSYVPQSVDLITRTKWLIVATTMNHRIDNLRNGYVQKHGMPVRRAARTENQH